MLYLYVCVCVPVLQLLQEDLELEQVRVNSLTHMVVVVDESSGDSATAALESKLQVRPYTHIQMWVKHWHCTHFTDHTERWRNFVGRQIPCGLIFISFKVFLEFLSFFLSTRCSLVLSLPHSSSLSGSGLSRLRLLFLGENRLNRR